MNVKIKQLPVKSLKPWGRNPRRHDVDRIVKSIERFGFRAPLVVNRRNMEIDPHYCDVIIKRWQDYTGQKAELRDG